MVNVNKLKGKMVEMNTNPAELAPRIGIDKATFYRKMAKGGDGFTVGEVDTLAKELQLDKDEVNAIFLANMSHNMRQLGRISRLNSAAVQQDSLAVQQDRREKAEMSGNEYEVQVICTGTFEDQGYMVKTMVFRVNGAAMNGWLNSEKPDPRMGFPDIEDYRAYCRRCDDARQAWNEEIKYLLGWNEPSGSITQNVSEIFTAVFMEKQETEE